MNRTKWSQASSVSQRGETQLSVVLWVLGIGVACSIFFIFQNFIEDHKDEKVKRRHEQNLSRKAPPADGKRKGYRLSY